MADAFALLWLPFVVAVCLVGIHTWFGIQVLTRNVIFVDLALAQVAALGATVAFMLGHAVQGGVAYAYSFVFTLGAALLLAFTRQWSGRISQEALIGVIYVVAAAAAFLLVDRAPQGAEHIKQILTGNILTVGLGDLALIAPLYAAVGIVHAMVRKPMAASASWGWDYFFYASFGLVVTSSVALAGVLLVFSFLIIPAAIGMLWSERLSRQLAIGWIAGSLASLVGLAASYAWDLPTGAAMVCTFGLSLAVAGMLWPLRGRSRKELVKAADMARFVLAIALAVSGLWMMAMPRADQPLLDTVEVAVPALRAAYMAPVEREAFRDATEHAERYRREGEKLNEREARSRYEGKAMDEMEVRRLSSFLKSYGEMRKGELFVRGEVRARARERNRFWLGLALLAFALVLVPYSYRRQFPRWLPRWPPR